MALRDVQSLSVSMQKWHRICVHPTTTCLRSGKTSLCNEFAANGFRILDENFLDMPAHSLHPQSLFMETKWVCSWFDRVLQLSHKPNTQRQVFFADRSPFSAVFYAAHGKLLEPLIRAQMDEVSKFADIEFVTLHVNVERELLWRRIQRRLQDEPERIRYMEHKRSKMEDCLAFYNAFPWDMHVVNDARSLPVLAEQIISSVAHKSHTMRVYLERMVQSKDFCMETDSDCDSETTMSCDDSPLKAKLASVEDSSPIPMHFE
ncbi:hypothetical protein DYB37_003877 [Aphanomyces astaci]|uniref:NadR/Ttd14 AAA domain-containing protein n=1 Tax=Aphanomyces astaci TaxID=112090 RepID=A0A397DR25_APHAT|nr:hypothetical protein DYB38_003032 [Aphanomyces astaci]RHY89593.1 hypothetical protein DYB35_004903 [Aphanomyces astaci]RHZ10857.1 hypothetical protein DYB31_003273 [Aphanomyces astaci]RHZ18443.1 hypothetical protein DYB37_003877 [Aphanomyces astaci]